MRTAGNSFGKIVAVTCIVLGGALGLWVIARLSSIMGRQQTWAPPFTQYEWITLGGIVAVAVLLITGLIYLTRST